MKLTRCLLIALLILLIPFSAHAYEKESLPTPSVIDVMDLFQGEITPAPSMFSTMDMKALSEEVPYATSLEELENMIAQGYASFNPEINLGFYRVDIPEIGATWEAGNGKNVLVDTFFRAALQDSYIRSIVFLNYYNSKAGEGYIEFTLFVNYLVDEEQDAFVDAYVADVSSRIITPGMSDMEKVKSIFDHIVLVTAYSKDTIGSPHSAYTLITEGEAVCQAYASLAIKMMRHNGIEGEYVVGDAGGSHAWNVAKIGSDWYYFDSTWGDTLPDNPGSISYRYFLKSNHQLRNTHTWDEPFYPVATKEEYNYFHKMWNATTVNGNIYFVNWDDRHRLYVHDRGTLEERLLVDEWVSSPAVHETEQWVYYQSASLFEYLFKVRPDGSEVRGVFVNDESVRGKKLYIEGTRLHFLNKETKQWEYKELEFDLDTLFYIDPVAIPEEGGEVTGQGIYVEGTQVTVTATANPGYTFRHWTDIDGNVITQSSSHTLTASEDIFLLAVFDEKPAYILVLFYETESGETLREEEAFFDLRETQEFPAPFIEGYEIHPDHSDTYTFIPGGEDELFIHTFIYQEIPIPATYQVQLQYLDTEGNPLLDPETHEGVGIGTVFTALDIEGYQLAEGYSDFFEVVETEGEDTLVFTFVYALMEEEGDEDEEEPVSYTLVIRYLTEEGNPVREDETHLNVEPGTEFLALDIEGYELVGESGFTFTPEPDVIEYQHSFVYAPIPDEPDDEEPEPGDNEPEPEPEPTPGDGENEPAGDNGNDETPEPDDDEEEETPAPPSQNNDNDRDSDRERDARLRDDRRSTRYIPGVNEPLVRVNATYTPRPLPIIPEHPSLFSHQTQEYHYVAPQLFQETLTYFVNNLDFNGEKDKLVVVPFIASEYQSQFFLSKAQLESLVAGQRNILLTDGSVGFLLEPHFMTTLQDFALQVSLVDGVYTITASHHETLNLIFFPNGYFSAIWYREHSEAVGYAVPPTQFAPDGTMVVWLEKNGQYTRNIQGF